MDFADLAAEREQLDRTLALQAQAHHQPALQPIGHCYNCGDPVDGVFCDRFCRDDYARIQSARVRNGE